ncbi:hypothetical protein HDU67_002115, partial [Dinochytrium kinnereticum]
MPIHHALPLSTPILTPRLTLHPCLCIPTIPPPSSTAPAASSRRPTSLTDPSDLPTPPPSLPRRRERTLSQASVASSALTDCSGAPIEGSFIKTNPPKPPTGDVEEWLQAFLESQHHLLGPVSPFLNASTSDTVPSTEYRASPATSAATLIVEEGGGGGVGKGASSPPASPPRKTPSWLNFLSSSRRSSKASSTIAATPVTVTAALTVDTAAAPSLEGEMQTLPKGARMVYVVEVRKWAPQPVRRSSTRHSKSSRRTVSSTASIQTVTKKGVEAAAVAAAAVSGREFIGVVEVRPGEDGGGNAGEGGSLRGLLRDGGWGFGSCASISMMGHQVLSSTAPTAASPLSLGLGSGGFGAGSSFSLPRDLKNLRRRPGGQSEDDEDAGVVSEEEEEEEVVGDFHGAEGEEEDDDGFPRFDCPHVTSVLYRDRMGVGYTTEAIKAVLLQLFRRDPMSLESGLVRGGDRVTKHFVFGGAGGEGFVVSGGGGGGEGAWGWQVGAPNRVAASVLDGWDHDDGEEDDDDMESLDEDEEEEEEADGMRKEEGGMMSDDEQAGDGEHPNERHHPTTPHSSHRKTSLAGERVLDRLGFRPTERVTCTTTTTLIDPAFSSSALSTPLGGGDAEGLGRGVVGRKGSAALSSDGSMTAGCVRGWQCFEIGRDGFWEVWVGEEEEEG